MQHPNRMHPILLALAALAAAALAATPSFARSSTTFNNPGEATVENDCAAVGGSFYYGNASSYSCIKGVNVVSCSGKKCTGTCESCSASVAGGVKGARGIKEFLRPPSRAKSPGRAMSPKPGRRPVAVGGVRERGHGRVVKPGLRKKAIYRSPGGPTDQGGKGLTGYRSTGPTFPEAERHRRRH